MYLNGWKGNLSYMDRGTTIPSLYRSDDLPRESLPETFVDRYTEWASLCTDAPVQYHRVHGMMILSAAISPYRAFEAGYGKVKPNIWSMILAGTTMTRKTTSMKLALSILKQCVPDFMMGTDGSPEGFFAEIAGRKGKVSMFHRDEISEWIEVITKREYMSGILGSFMKFYDGQEEKKVLRSATYTIEDPNFIVMSGGIQGKMEELIDLNHIRSGFIPRFIIVIGQTTLEQMTPIGPPKGDSDGRDERERVVEELYKIVEQVKPHTAQNTNINFGNVIAIPKATPNLVKVLPLTDEAWARVQRLERDGYVESELTGNKDLFDPMFQRMVTTIIKCSVLLAASRGSETVELTDVLCSIAYSDEWVEGMMKFCKAIELRPSLTVWERKIFDVIRFLKENNPMPVTRSEVMRKFHLGKKQMDEIEATLEDRQYIKISTSLSNGKRGRPAKTYELEMVMPAILEGNYV